MGEAGHSQGQGGGEGAGRVGRPGLPPIPLRGMGEDTHHTLAHSPVTYRETGQIEQPDFLPPLRGREGGTPHFIP